MAGQSKLQNSEFTENSQESGGKQKKKCVDFFPDELAVLFDNRTALSGSVWKETRFTILNQKG